MSSRKSTTRREQYHHGDARAALIEAATDLVKEHGPEGFSMREAARRVGIDPAACYRHFRDRSELLIAIAQRGFLELAEAMTVAQQSDADPRVQLLAMGRCYVDYALDHPAHFRVMFGGAGISARDSALAAPELLRSSFDLLKDSVHAWLKVLEPQPKVESTAVMLWAAVHGVARLQLDGALPLPRSDVQELVEGLCRAVLAGIRAS